MKEPRRPKHLLLQWHITDRCNLRCRHCYQEAHAGKELDTCALMAILEQFIDFVAGCRKRAAPGEPPVRCHITLTGGEPFLRDDFFDLVEAIRSRGPYISFAILTNGSLVDRATARGLRRFEPVFVQVSIEGSKARHDDIRGVGSHDRTVSAIRSLVGEGIPTYVAFTAHRENFRDFPEVVRLGERLGVSRVWADRLIPVGTGAAMQSLNPVEARELFGLMWTARARAARAWGRRTEVAMNRGLQFLVAGGRPYRCTAGDSLLAIMPDGTLYPCRRMPIPVGNLLETPLHELYHRSEMLRALRDPSRMGEGCSECCFADLCRGGLRCLAHALTGSPFRADPGCWNAKDSGLRKK